MKKDRNCNMPYPMYPNYMPIQMMPNQMVTNQMMPNQMTNNMMNYDDQINMINNKISNLEKRINNLESLNSTGYNNSGYQMM